MGARAFSTTRALLSPSGCRVGRIRGRRWIRSGRVRFESARLDFSKVIISAGNRPRRRRRAFWTGEIIRARRFYIPPHVGCKWSRSGWARNEPPFHGEPPRVGSATAAGAPRTTKGLTATAKDDDASRRRRLRGRRGERALSTPLARRASRGTLGAPPARPRGARVVHAPSPRARAVRGGVSLVARARARAPPVATLARARLHARVRPVVAGASRAARVRPSTRDAPEKAPATRRSGSLF